jgi:hypothetical protein
VLHEKNIGSSFEGIKKMVCIFTRSDDSIKKRVCSNFQRLFLSEDLETEIQASYLIKLAMDLNYSELSCLKEIFLWMLQNQQIGKELVFEIWKVFNNDPERMMQRLDLADNDLEEKHEQLKKEQLTALRLLNFTIAYDENLVTEFTDEMIRILNTKLNKDVVEWPVITEFLFTIEKLYPIKRDSVSKQLTRIVKTVVKFYGVNNSQWFQTTQKMIDTLFVCSENPENLSEYILMTLLKPLIRHNKELFMINKNQLSQKIEPIMNSDRKSVSSEDDQMTNIKLAQLIFTAGHIGFSLLSYIEKLEEKIKKQKSTKQNEKDNKDG